MLLLQKADWISRCPTIPSGCYAPPQLYLDHLPIGHLRAPRRTLKAVEASPAKQSQTGHSLHHPCSPWSTLQENLQTQDDSLADLGQEKGWVLTTSFVSGSAQGCISPMVKQCCFISVKLGVLACKTGVNIPQSQSSNRDSMG